MCMFMLKRKGEKDQFKDLYREVHIMSNLANPNILDLPGERLKQAIQ